MPDEKKITEYARFAHSTLMLLRGILDKYEELARNETGWNITPFNPVDEKVMTTDEARSYLHISTPTLIKYLRDGKIKGTKAGKGYRFLKSELNKFLLSQ